jgi:glycosyl transferase family 11
MIVSHMFGGLGNQLFQFAIGKAMAARLGVEFRMDSRYFDRPRPDNLCMQHFGHGTAQVHRIGLPAMRQDGLLPYIGATLRGSRFRLYKETTLGYDPATRDLGDGTYLKGYWQSEKYFKDHAKLVRDHLSITTPPTPENSATMLAQDACFPVSLHIRRGDYVTNAKFNATHGTCDLDYYRRAADYLAERSASAPTFFAFSDDPDWVRDNLNLPYKMHFVSHNGVETNYEDVRLMSRCRHHIIANSSFSWWGAWLNPDPDKIVVAPKRWFAAPDMQDHDLVPEDWVQL